MVQNHRAAIRMASTTAPHCLLQQRLWRASVPDMPETQGLETVLGESGVEAGLWPLLLGGQFPRRLPFLWGMCAFLREKTEHELASWETVLQEHM